MKYEIKEFRMVRTEHLYPGDAAAQFASDEDDRAAVMASQDDVGTLQPLIVVPGHKPGTFCVLDGLGRLKGALEHEDAEGRPDPIPELPCLVVSCDDPRALALHVNGASRKHSTGSRVLCFLLAHKERVMEAQEYMDGTGNGHATVRGGDKRKNRADIPDDIKPWTIAGVSKRLKVSDKDVALALELMICRDTLTYPSRATFGRHASGESMKDDGDVEALDRAYTGVLCGRTPVRRWAAAFAGRSTNDGKGKADTDYGRLADRTSTSLIGVFENWGRIQWESRAMREQVETRLAAALAVMPECCKTALLGLIPQSWGPHEKAALVKAIGKKS